MNDLDKAVERLESVDQPYDRRLTYRRVREDDLRLLLSVLHQRGEALRRIAAYRASVVECTLIARQALSNTTGSRGVE